MAVRTFGTNAVETMLTAGDMLTMATLGGAFVSDVGEPPASLTPERQADVVVIDAGTIGVSLMRDPAAADAKAPAA